MGPFRVGTFWGWDVLRLGTFCSLGRFGVGSFWSWDVLGLGAICSWDLLGLGRFTGGTLCSGTFCSWDVSGLGRFVLGRFVGAPLKLRYAVPGFFLPYPDKMNIKKINCDGLCEVQTELQDISARIVIFFNAV